MNLRNKSDTQILNSENIEITQTQVEQFLQQFGVTSPLYNFNLYKRAFIHESYTIDRVPMQTHESILSKLHTKSNQRLEFLGDGVLECIIKYYIYKRFPKADEGFLTDVKIELVKNATIGQLAIKMGLDRYYIISHSMELSNIRSNAEIMGCLFEAFVGAIFLDYNRMELTDDEWMLQPFHCGPGFQIAQIFVENVYNKLIDWSIVLTQSPNYKRPLQELLQYEFKVTPIYTDGKRNISRNGKWGFYRHVYLCIGTTLNCLSTYEKSKCISEFHSFRDIHLFIAEHKRLLVLLGQGFDEKKKNAAEQNACKNAIHYIRDNFSDFESTTGRIFHKYSSSS